MIKVFIGYDANEVVAYNVLAYSIIEYASEPVSIIPIKLQHLSSIHNRPRHKLASTEFSFSRFLVPHLCDYEGWAIFMDCDMLVRKDIATLWNLRDDNYAVQVVKHDHKPKEEVKFLNQAQTKYEKKNWSSVMLLNCSKCEKLTKDYVNTATGLELHQFKWLEGDHLIGEIPHQWNHLVGYDPFDAEAANVHFTEGGPYFNEYHDCEYSSEWNEMKEKMLFVKQRDYEPKKVINQ